MKKQNTISMAIYVRGTYRQTQLFYWLIIGRFTIHVSALFLGHYQAVSRTYSRLYYMLLIGNGCFGEPSLLQHANPKDKRADQQIEKWQYTI